MTDQSNSNVQVSIALCTYNGQRYLTEQIDSLLMQDHPQFEIVIVDDGSSDGTIDLLGHYQRRDPRIRLFFNEKNLGFLKNFERAVSLCSGEWIAPCDQDDIWKSDKISTLLKQAGDVSLTYCNSSLIDEAGNPLGKQVSDLLNMYEGDDPSAFTFHNCVSGHAMLFKRDLLKYALPFPRVQFHDAWLAFVATSLGGIRYVNAPLVDYRQQQASITNLSGRRKTAPHSNRFEVYDRQSGWIRSLSGLPSVHQPWFRKLSELWEAHETQWLSPELVDHLSQRKEALMHIGRKKRRNLGSPNRYWVGLRPKSLLLRNYQRSS